MVSNIAISAQITNSHRLQGPLRWHKIGYLQATSAIEEYSQDNHIKWKGLDYWSDRASPTASLLL